MAITDSWIKLWAVARPRKTTLHHLDNLKADKSSPTITIKADDFLFFFPEKFIWKMMQIG